MEKYIILEVHRRKMMDIIWGVGGRRSFTAFSGDQGTDHKKSCSGIHTSKIIHPA
jgi:hypothetical protein